MTGLEKEPASAKITARQRATLRGLGNTLKAVLTVGKDGLTDTVLAQLDGLLEHHELVKIKILKTAEVDRHELADELAARARATLVHVIGRTMLLYRRHPRKPRLLVDAPEGN